MKYVYFLTLVIILTTGCVNHAQKTTPTQVADSDWCEHRESKLVLIEEGQAIYTIQESSLRDEKLTMNDVIRYGIFIFKCPGDSVARVNVQGREVYIETVPLNFYKTAGKETPYGLKVSDVAGYGSLYYILNGPPDNYGRIESVRFSCPTFHLYGYPRIPLIFIPKEMEPGLIQYFKY